MSICPELPFLPYVYYYEGKTKICIGVSEVSPTPHYSMWYLNDHIMISSITMGYPQSPYYHDILNHHISMVSSWYPHSPYSDILNHHVVSSIPILSIIMISSIPILLWYPQSPCGILNPYIIMVSSILILLWYPQSPCGILNPYIIMVSSILILLWYPQSPCGILNPYIIMISSIPILLWYPQSPCGILNPYIIMVSSILILLWYPQSPYHLSYQSCRTSRQRLGVNRIDSCNFELCSQGQLCITINSRYSRMGWAAMSNKLRGCHLANAWRSRSKHILQWRYRNEASVHSFIHCTLMTPSCTSLSLLQILLYLLKHLSHHFQWHSLLDELEQTASQSIKNWISSHWHKTTTSKIFWSNKLISQQWYHPMLIILASSLTLTCPSLIKSTLYPNLVIFISETSVKFVIFFIFLQPQLLQIHLSPANLTTAIHFTLASHKQISTNFTAFKIHWHVSLQILQNINTSHQHSKNYIGFLSNKESITKSVFSHTKHLQINNLQYVFHFRHILFLHDLLIHLFFPFHMSDHHLAKGLSLSSVHDSGIHSLLIPETCPLYQYSVPGSPFQNCISSLGSFPSPLTVYPDFDSY